MSVKFGMKIITEIKFRFKENGKNTSIFRFVGIGFDSNFVKPFVEDGYFQGGRSLT
jgi:hypothetical protein